jgi:ABC-type lipopolysaccharide export system ATPase subunit
LRFPATTLYLRSGTTNYAQLRLSFVRKESEGPELDASLGLEARGLLKEQRCRIDEALAPVGLGKFARAFPHQLSGGMAQRASLARALVKADSILLSLWASAAPLMVYDRRSARSRALYAGTQVLFCSAMTLGS